MINLRGFWSYVHADDEAEQRRITQLARDVVQEFGLVSGEEINLFVDRDSIEWGENWADTINNNLSTAGFFIPILTERYFQRPYCRYELQTFFQKASDLGLKELILPILYVDVDGFLDQSSDDQLVLKTAKLQCQDWRDLRLCERSSERYRRAVADIVRKLVDANKEAEIPAHSVSVAVASSVKKNVDEQPDRFDKMENSAKEFRAVPDMIYKVLDELKKINVIVTGHLDEPKDIYSRSKFAAQLVEPTENIWKYVNMISEKLYNADIGFRLLVEESSAQVEKHPEIKKKFCSTVASIRSLAVATHEGNQYTAQMIKELDTFVTLSRELRPVGRRLQQGLTYMVELGSLYDEWIDLADASGIECESVSA